MSTNGPAFDPRVTAARPDLAAAALRGKVEAERFAEGEIFTVVTETADLKRQPRPDAALETQLLYGETLVVFDDEDGWGWVQADRDGYVGYVAMGSLARSAIVATHRVVVNRTFVYPAPDMKQPCSAALPLNGRVRVEEEGATFSKITGHGFVFASHLGPIDEIAPDYVTVAERLIGVPYLWGGKSPLGIDCSGLVQIACAAAGYNMPRDTDMQENVGEKLAVDEALKGLIRGDLVFWKGHVGLMMDAVTLLHANAHHMLVMREPLAEARDRIFATSSTPITSVRRITFSR